MRKFKVTTPLRVLVFTITEWIDYGYEWAMADVELARLVDSSGDYRFVLEVQRD